MSPCLRVPASVFRPCAPSPTLPLGHKKSNRYRFEFFGHGLFKPFFIDDRSLDGAVSYEFDLIEDLNVKDVCMPLNFIERDDSPDFPKGNFIDISNQGRKLKLAKKFINSLKVYHNINFCPQTRIRLNKCGLDQQKINQISESIEEWLEI